MIKNSMFAEQSNKMMKPLKESAVHMKQFTLLWVIRFFLYKMSMKKGMSFLHRNAAQHRASVAQGILDRDLSPAPPATSRVEVTAALQQLAGLALQAGDEAGA